MLITPRNFFKDSLLSGTWKDIILSFLAFNGTIPLALMWCPKYFTSCLKNDDFLGLNYKPACRRWSSTSLTSCSCSRHLSDEVPQVGECVGVLYRLWIEKAKISTSYRFPNCFNEVLNSMKGLSINQDLAGEHLYFRCRVNATRFLLLKIFH